MEMTSQEMDMATCKKKETEKRKCIIKMKK